MGNTFSAELKCAKDAEAKKIVLGNFSAIYYYDYIMMVIMLGHENCIETYEQKALQGKIRMPHASCLIPCNIIICESGFIIPISFRFEF